MQTPLILSAGGKTFLFSYDEWDRPLFIALGAALAEAQALEFHLAHLLGMAAKSPEEQIEGFLTRTLGHIARKLRELSPDDRTAELLDELVARRNHLLHGFLRAHGWPMSSIEEYAAAVQELDEIRRVLRSGSEAVTVALRKAHGLEIIIVRTNPETGQPELVE